MKLKIMTKLKEAANSILGRFTSVLNQLPERNTKVRQSPLFHHQMAFAMARKPPVDPSVHNHSRDRRRKGPRHSSTRTYNHPRGDIRRG